MRVDRSLGLAGCGLQLTDFANPHQRRFDARFILLRKGGEMGLSQNRCSKGSAGCHEEVESEGKGRAWGRGGGDDALLASASQSCCRPLAVARRRKMAPPHCGAAAGGAAFSDRTLALLAVILIVVLMSLRYLSASLMNGC